jgi:hypothetical protein
MQFAKQDVATWLFDEANIFHFDIFVRKKGWLAKQAGYLGHDPWHTRYEHLQLSITRLLRSIFFTNYQL